MAFVRRVIEKAGTIIGKFDGGTSTTKSKHLRATGLEIVLEKIGASSAVDP